MAVLPGEQVIVRERGYEEREQTVPVSELPRLLKTIIKREFPRSRKVRIQKFFRPEELSRPRKIL